MGACLSTPATQDDATWKDLEGQGGPGPASKTAKDPTPPPEEGKETQTSASGIPDSGVPGSGSPPGVPPLERKNTKGSSDSDELGQSMGSLRKFFHLPGKHGQVAPGQGRAAAAGIVLGEPGRAASEEEGSRHRPAWEAASLGRARIPVPRAATDSLKYNDSTGYIESVGYSGRGPGGYGDSRPGTVTAGLQAGGLQAQGMGLGLGMGMQGVGEDGRDPRETLSLRPRGTGHVAAQGAQQRPLLPIGGALPHSSSQNALAADSWQTAGQGDGLETYAFPRPVPDRGVSLMLSQDTGGARHSGSVHGFGGRYGGATRGVGGDEGSVGRGGGMMGLHGMGSASLHGGMGTGSLHGGSGKPSSVALRALQAAKLRATKPALERHNVHVHGHGSELLVFSHAFGYNRSVWTNIIQNFDPFKYRIVLYDLTGALGTDYDAFDFQRYSTLHGFAEDLLLLLTELGVEGSGWGQQCTFIGHQHSGMMGLLAAIEKPRVFKRIITIASTPRLLDAPGYEGSFALADLDQVFGIMQANFKTWSKGFAPVLNADDIKAPHVRQLSRQLFLLRPDVAFSNLKTAFACDLRDILPKVEVQVHMLFLAKDQTVPQSVIQMMLATVPNAYAEILPLDSFSARPDVVAAAILRHATMPLRDIRESSRRIGSMRYTAGSQAEEERGGSFDVDGGVSGWRHEEEPKGEISRE